MSAAHTVLTKGDISILIGVWGNHGLVIRDAYALESLREHFSHHQTGHPLW